MQKLFWCGFLCDTSGSTKNCISIVYNLLPTHLGKNFRSFPTRDAVYPTAFFPHKCISHLPWPVKRTNSWSQLVTIPYTQLPPHTVQSPHDSQAKCTAAHRKFWREEGESNGTAPHQVQYCPCNATLSMWLGTIAKESPEIKSSQNTATLRAHNTGWNQPFWRGRQEPTAIKRAGILKHLKPGLGEYDWQATAESILHWSCTILTFQGGWWWRKISEGINKLEIFKRII